uniref:4-hydroxybenzoate polyprenyltransferase, mitochondrial n=1 Tax=Strigamia maritima TaxID=126957 RepID=T1IY16_STRMM
MFYESIFLLTRRSLITGNQLWQISSTKKCQLITPCLCISTNVFLTKINSKTHFHNAYRLKSTFPEKLVQYSPLSLQPYLRLMRVDKPIGTWLLFWPCGWSLALAAGANSVFPDPSLVFLFGAGAFFMRGAGCTINDMWDRDLDAKVERTKNRPLASGELTMLDALACLAGQLGISLCILLQLNCIVLGTSSLGIVIAYPLMKRLTNWPQLTLGMAFNWGALLGWSAVYGSCNWAVCFPLYLAGISWTLVYDTIYAHQDTTDDLIVGIKSTALTFGKYTRQWLTLFSTSMIANLCAVGVMADQTLPYFMSVTLAGGILAHQIVALDIADSEDCKQKFQANKHVGTLIFLGILLGNLYSKLEEPPSNLLQGSSISI